MFHTKTESFGFKSRQIQEENKKNANTFQDCSRVLGIKYKELGRFLHKTVLEFTLKNIGGWRSAVSRDARIRQVNDPHLMTPVGSRKIGTISG